ncbi:hypothetical protein ACOMHN_008222 [Nucella lapillus]
MAKNALRIKVNGARGRPKVLRVPGQWFGSRSPGSLFWEATLGTPDVSTPCLITCVTMATSQARGDNSG